MTASILQPTSTRKLALQCCLQRGHITTCAFLSNSTQNGGILTTYPCSYLRVYQIQSRRRCRGSLSKELQHSFLFLEPLIRWRGLLLPQRITVLSYLCTQLGMAKILSGRQSSLPLCDSILEMWSHILTRIGPYPSGSLKQLMVCPRFRGTTTKIASSARTQQFGNP